MEREDRGGRGVNDRKWGPDEGEMKLRCRWGEMEEKGGTMSCKETQRLNDLITLKYH